MDGTNPLEKARGNADGRGQEQGRDYWDKRSPTARAPNVRLLLGVATEEDWEIRQIDIDAAFLYGKIEPEY